VQELQRFGREGEKELAENMLNAKKSAWVLKGLFFGMFLHGLVEGARGKIRKTNGRNSALGRSLSRAPKGKKNCLVWRKKG